MRGWLDLAGYQAVWFAAVLGAGAGLAWPGVAAAAVFVLVQMALSPQPGADARLLVAAVAAGAAVDGGLALSGWAGYAAAWPSARFAPAWILALWCAFALSLPRGLRVLQSRPALAAALGALGAPAAYLAAESGWGALEFAAPRWRGLLWLAAGWALALPLLSALGRCPAPAAAGARP